MNMKSISYTAARSNLSKMIEQVRDDHAPIAPDLRTDKLRTRHILNADRIERVATILYLQMSAHSLCSALPAINKYNL